MLKKNLTKKIWNLVLGFHIFAASNNNNMDITTKVAQTQMLNSIGEREFDPRETMQWLAANKLWLFTWAFREPVNFMNKVFYFKVSGHHHKGYVVITLAWDDTYTVRLVSNKWVEKSKFEMVYCDQLAELIDEKVERIAAYER